MNSLGLGWLHTSLVADRSDQHLSCVMMSILSTRYAVIVDNNAIILWTCVVDP
jgi:hypothetical protein